MEGVAKVVCKRFAPCLDCGKQAVYERTPDGISWHPYCDSCDKYIPTPVRLAQRRDRERLGP